MVWQPLPPIRGLRGRPRRKPRALFANRGYDHDACRRLLRARGIAPRIAHRGAAYRSVLVQRRWGVERGFAGLHACKRLRTRWERRIDFYLGLPQLTYVLICHQRLIALWNGFLADSTYEAARNLMITVCSRPNPRNDGAPLRTLDHLRRSIISRGDSECLLNEILRLGDELCRLRERNTQDLGCARNKPQDLGQGRGIARHVVRIWTGQFGRYPGACQEQICCTPPCGSQLCRDVFGESGMGCEQSDDDFG